MAKSLAFWLEGGKYDDPKIDLHINYWLLHQNTDRELNYIDVGVQFQGMMSATSINIYFPFKVTKENYYSPLGELVCSRRDLIQTIFNARHKSTSDSSNTSVDIEFESEKESRLRFFTQISCSPENGGVRIIETGDGSTISFPVDLFRSKEKEGAEVGNQDNLCNTLMRGLQKSTLQSEELTFDTTPIPGYFRFRVILGKDERKTISQSYKHSDSIVLSRLEATEIVDFRLNEVRDLPGILQSKDLIQSGIKNIHFFLIREVDSEYKQAHADFKRCRLLEKDLWNDYLNPTNERRNNPPKQMLIYHWKEYQESKDPNKKGELVNIEKFTAFAKFSKITVTSKTFSVFILCALFLGAISGAMGNVLYGYVVEELKIVLSMIRVFYAIHFL